jgi:hypothetical protein
MEYDNSFIFHLACYYLRGASCVSMLSLLLSNTALKTITYECLPIYMAAAHSCVDVLQFLHKIYPESMSMLRSDGKNTLLHAAVRDKESDISEVNAKIRYICDQCPALVCLKDDYGDTVLHEIVS